MTLQLGVYSFGNTPRTADGGYGATAQAIRDLLQAVQVAEERIWGQSVAGGSGHRYGRR
jgi:hypothetical protein